MSGPAFGQSNASSDTSDYNSMDFIIRAALAGMQTVSVVKVVAVHGGGVAPTGTVDVQVVVNLMTGGGTAVPHGTIYGVPFTRAQGGNSAFICDPAVGDIGMAAFASRDITSVKNSRKAANPSSKRMFDWADAIYASGMLNGTPTEYIQMTNGSGIKVVSPGAVDITSPANTVNGPATVTGATTLEGAVTAQSTLHAEGAVTADSTIAAAGAISSSASLAAPSVTTASLNISAGGSTSFPAGSIAGAAMVDASITSAKLANTGVTPDSYTNANVTVNAQGQITAAANGSGGGSGSFNITPDLHPSIPAGVGLGPNDEFEIGSVIDTAGTRYPSATAWSAFNLGTGSTSIDASGSVTFFPTVAAGVNYSGYTQPLPGGGNWSYVAKIAFAGVTSNQIAGLLLATASGAAGHIYLFGVSNSTLTAQRATNSTTFSANAVNISSFFGVLSNIASTPWVYLKISWNAGTTTLSFAASLTGAPGSYLTVLTETAATFLGTPTLLGIGAQNQASVVTGLIADYFRRVT